MLLSVAVSGVTVAVRVKVLPMNNVADSLSRVMLSTGTWTVILQDAFFPPFAVVTVIVASPTPSAVTLPVVAPTFATASSSEDQVTLLFVALSGETVAVNVMLSPTASMFLEGGSIVTPATSTKASFTVTLHLAVFPPSSVLTVIKASPGALAVT